MNSTLTIFRNTHFYYFPISWQRLFIKSKLSTPIDDVRNFTFANGMSILNRNKTNVAHKEFHVTFSTNNEMELLRTLIAVVTLSGWQEREEKKKTEIESK